MVTETEVTRVIFRKFKDGGVIAIFPDMPETKLGTYNSYMHVGQHGAASWPNNTLVKAFEPDYRNLLAELKQIGYTNIKVIQKWPRSKR